MTDYVYLVYEVDGTSMSARPGLKCATLDRELAERMVAEWDIQTHWSSLSIRPVELVTA